MDFLPEAEQILSEVFEEMQVPSYEGLYIDLEGQMDGALIRPARFPTNCELYAARVSSMVRYVFELGIKPSRPKVAPTV